MAGLHAYVSFLIPFAFVAITTPFLRKYALRWKLGDKPNGRKIHTSTIPHIGGLGMVFGTLAGVTVAAFLFDETADGVGPMLGRFIFPVVIIVALGLTDDMKNLKARQKLAVQIVASVILAFSGFQLLVGLPAFDENQSFVILLSSFYLVGISSSVNLVDGLDGLAAGLALISAAAFGVLALVVGAHALVCVSLAVGGACVGFLIYNFPPGKIFMGDTGSMFLGILLGIIACSFTMLQPGINTFFAVGFILAVPMIDSWLAIARRLILRRPVFQADCMHIHHVLSSFGFSARQTLVILYSMQAVMAFLGILSMRGLVIPLVVGSLIIFLVFSTFIRIMVAAEPRAGAVAAEFPRNSVPSLEK